MMLNFNCISMTDYKNDMDALSSDAMRTIEALRVDSDKWKRLFVLAVRANGGRLVMRAQDMVSCPESNGLSPDEELIVWRTDENIDLEYRIRKITTDAAND
jgi:hypothetical protein